METISRADYQDSTQAIGIDDCVYPVPERTQATQDKLTAIEKNKALSEYDRNYKVVEAVLGTDAVKKIFTRGKNENLDYMAGVSLAVLTVYSHTQKEMDEQKYQQAMDKIQPVADAMDKVGGVMAHAQK